MKGNRKVFVIGLDCAPPRLVFDEWKAELPNLSRLQDEGIWGPLESCIPPITVPAWSSMLSSKDPGQLGFYGFRNRGDHSYEKLVIANATSVKEPRVWDLLSKAGKHVVLVGVPQTYPPRPVNGEMVTCFLTPDTKGAYTYPPALKAEVEGLVGEYILDVKEFRTDEKKRILDEIHEMTRRRFTLVRHLMRTRPWDFFMFVEMGVDRIHHGFWKYYDRFHRLYEAGHPFEHAIRDYYKVVDAGIGEMLAGLDADTSVLVVSDHGARKMEGAICFNEWLIREGYLALKSKPQGITRFDPTLVDWTRTKAWGDGGYYGRLFLNVQGREPQGVIPRDRYGAERDLLIRKLEAITDEAGKNIGTVAYKPEEVYRQVNGVPPDLIVYFGDLDWRSAGTLGHPTIWSRENDTGPDEANHDRYGIFILRDRGLAARGERTGLRLTDVAPTILTLMGEPVPADMIGKSVV